MLDAAKHMAMGQDAGCGVAAPCRDGGEMRMQTCTAVLCIEQEQL
jgi:hypothetical protein